MVIVVVRPTPVARLIGVTTSEQSANPASAFKTSSQVTPPGVAHGRAACPLLNHSLPVINIVCRRPSNPTGRSAAIPGEVLPFAHPPETIIGEIAPPAGGANDTTQLVLIVVAVGLCPTLTGAQVAVGVISTTAPRRAGQLILTVHRERIDRDVIGPLV